MLLRTRMPWTASPSAAPSPVRMWTSSTSRTVLQLGRLPKSFRTFLLRASPSSTTLEGSSPCQRSSSRLSTSLWRAMVPSRSTALVAWTPGDSFSAPPSPWPSRSHSSCSARRARCRTPASPSRTRPSTAPERALGFPAALSRKETVCCSSTTSWPPAAPFRLESSASRCVVAQWLSAPASWSSSSSVKAGKNSTSPAASQMCRFGP
mmetsp:Transcript_6321/g.18496  ORF Transcript_6321/g.18496 Transcript_6321/m.18496 type:complete len:207 (+) Transcript_6321:939-1559(+)